MRRQKPSVYLTAFIYVLIIYVADMLSDRILGIREAMYRANEVMMGGGTPDIMSYLNLSVVGVLLCTALSIMVSVVSIGFTMYCVFTSRNQEAGIGTLFDGFGMFFKVLWLLILEYVYTFLWSLLFIVPGIIASYRYRMAIYLLIDDPTKGANQCIKESKELMKGRKMELFVLDLTLIGWMFLASIPIGGIFAYPYIETVYANYYNVITGQPYGDGAGSGFIRGTEGWTDGAWRNPAARDETEEEPQEPPQSGEPLPEDTGRQDDHEDRPPWEY